MNLFFEPNKQTHKTRRNLPHWTQLGKMYFVTFRLADSLPQKRLEQIQQERKIWSACHSKPYSEQEWQEYHRLFSERIEHWLDAGHGECILAQPVCVHRTGWQSHAVTTLWQTSVIISFFLL